MKPLQTPEGFFDQQRKDVLAMVRKEPRHWPRAVAALIGLGFAAWWWDPTEQPCETFSCLLDATPTSELPVDWAMESLLNDDTWHDWAMEFTDEQSF